MPESHETPNHPTQRKTAEDPWPDIKKKKKQSTIQHVPVITRPKQENLSLTTSKKNPSTAPMDIIEVEPDDNKTMMTTSRMGADMRSAKNGIVLERPSSINATKPRGPQQESSRADQQGVHKTPRRPFSRGNLICIIIGHSRKPQHAHRTDWAPRPSLLKKNAHTVANIMCMTPQLPDQRQMALKAKIARNTQPSNPAKNRRRPIARHQKPHHNSKHLPLITGRKEENFDTY